MIRLATINDLDSIMAIIKNIQIEMTQENNPQWNIEDDYPNKDKFLSDLNKKELYVYDDGIIKGFMAITSDDNYHELVNTTPKKPMFCTDLLLKKKTVMKDWLQFFLSLLRN